MKIKEYLKNIGVHQYKINNGKIDCMSGTTIHNFQDPITRVSEQELKIEFNEVFGGFSCIFSDLTTSKGLPQIVHGDFVCTHSMFTDLKYGPKIIDGDLNCNNLTYLTTLEGLPTKVGDCIFESLAMSSLDYCPETINGHFVCYSNNDLTTLRGFPTFIGGNCSIPTRLNKKLSPYEYRWLLFSNILGEIKTDRAILNKFLNEHKNLPKKDLPKILSELRKIQL